MKEVGKYMLLMKNTTFKKKCHGLGSLVNSGCIDRGLCFTTTSRITFSTLVTIHPEHLIKVGLNNAHVYSSLCNLKFCLCTIAFVKTVIHRLETQSNQAAKQNPNTCSIFPVEGRVYLQLRFSP